MIPAAELARELEEQDASLAAEIEAVDRLQHRTAEVAARAAELETLERTLPGRRARLAQAVAGAAAELAAREQAQRDLAAREFEDEAEARRAAVRAADLVAVARRGLERAREEQAVLEARGAALPQEIAELAAAGADVTVRLGHDSVMAPPSSPAGLAEWASRARAALLVERSGLDTRRERLVREANELASAVLGEQVATSVTGVRERLEREALGRNV